MARYATHRSPMSFTTFPAIIVAWFTLCLPQIAGACDGRPFGSPTLTLNTTNISLTYSGTSAHSYIPATVTLPSGFSGTCTLVIDVFTNQHPMQSTFEHTQASQNTLNFYLPPPFEWNGGSYIQWIYGGQGQVIETNIPFTIPANQLNKPAGLYRRDFIVRLRNVIRGGYYFEGYLTASATVATSCNLPPPSLSSVDFSGAVINGTIPAPFQRSLSFSNAGCNSPARLTLAGQALRHPNSPARIHYTASAILGASAITLDTQTSAFVFANAIGAPASNSIPVSITVLPSTAPLPAGTYSSILRVSLEPSQ